jgi:hypothetical protein
MLKIVRGLGVVLVSAAILSANVAQAMEIYKFDKMSDADQKEYVGELVEGAQRVLREDGRSDLAEKVAKLFTTKAPDSDISIGMSAFITNLALTRVSDLKRLEKDPHATRLEVEHAMILTLKHRDIVLPKSFMNVMKDFMPKHALKNQ